jgi:hypothetical protein
MYLATVRRLTGKMSLPLLVRRREHEAGYGFLQDGRKLNEPTLRVDQSASIDLVLQLRSYYRLRTHFFKVRNQA